MAKYVLVSFTVLLSSVKCFSNWLVFFSCLFIYFNPGSGIAKTVAVVTRLCWWTPVESWFDFRQERESYLFTEVSSLDLGARP